jgi:hypothetical protein
MFHIFLKPQSIFPYILSTSMLIRIPFQEKNLSFLRAPDTPTCWPIWQPPPSFSLILRWVPRWPLATAAGISCPDSTARPHPLAAKPAPLPERTTFEARRPLMRAHARVRPCCCHRALSPLHIAPNRSDKASPDNGCRGRFDPWTNTALTGSSPKPTLPHSSYSTVPRLPPPTARPCTSLSRSHLLPQCACLRRCALPLVQAAPPCLSLQ